MNALEQTTKERILAAALDMFCVKGYQAVSVRDIGRAVGIKESSIYYHFKNKDDILQEILRQAEQLTQRLKDGFNLALSAVSSVERDKFIGVGISYIEDYLLDERIFKLVKMLTIEKQTNADAAGIYHKLMFVTPLEHHEKVFEAVMERGYIKQDDRACLASEYQSVILFIFQKYFSGPEVIKQEIRSAAKNELTSLLGRFYDHYFNGEA